MEFEIYDNVENDSNKLDEKIDNEFFQFASLQLTAIEPPPEFQDEPDDLTVEKYAFDLTNQIILVVLKEFQENTKRLNQKTQKINRDRDDKMKKKRCSSTTINYSSSYKISELRPNSIVAPIARQHFSSSHDSLLMSLHKFNDDSTSYIKQAVSHDVIYNVPFDNCLDDFSTYAVPIESQYKKFNNAKKKKRKRYNSVVKSSNLCAQKDPYTFRESKKRYSLAGTSSSNSVEPIHMTLEEVRNYLHDLYSESSSDTSERPRKITPPIGSTITDAANNCYRNINCDLIDYCSNNNKFNNNTRNNKTNNNNYNCDRLTNGDFVIRNSNEDDDKKKKLNAKFSTIKRALCGIFKFKRKPNGAGKLNNDKESSNNLVARALPPLPTTKMPENGKECKIGLDGEQILDFATSIQKVKDYGWYWGPISSEAAEKILSNEPDGSFIVRDSSDDHYIFSLTFKLNDFVRHVRIDHDQGNFSFGSCTRFKSQTIVEFIENAVEHSRSGRYLFFLHRRPVIGPVRVQLLHPVSRFKQIQSLQHMCRFIIHKMVRRDLIPTLPLPRRMIDYLNTPHYYSENLEIDEGAAVAVNRTNGGTIVRS